MTPYYLKNALRSFKKYQGFSALNLLGLVLGISSCLLVILYLDFELKFDKFHEKGENVYRVVMHQPGNQVMGSSSDWWVVSPAILKPTWESELPEVDMAVRTTNRNWTFKYQNQFIDEKILVVDPEFFDVFSFPLRAGVEKEALKAPYSIVVSPEMAKKYFGTENPIGKTMILSDDRQVEVTGVLEELPANSHLQFDFLVSFQTLESILGRSLLSDNWLNNSYRTYLTLHRNTDLEQFDAKLRKYDIDGFNGKKWSFHLQPLFDIHFNRQTGGVGDRGTLFIFLSVGVFILFIAGFNYMNLYIAHYRTRSKNISVQKVIGASRGQLILQFLSESFLLVFIAYLVSIVLVRFALPLFNQFLGQELTFSALWRLPVLATSLGAAALMALIAGAYPSLYLSRQNIITGIKGGIEKFSKSNQYFRKAVVAVQFSISILLIVGSIAVFKQLKYTGNKSLGYQKENIIYLEADGLIYREDGEWKSKIKAFKQELLKNANIVSAAASSGIPSSIGWSNIPVWAGKAEDEKPFFYRLKVDYDFLDLYGIKVEQGRDFSPEAGTDSENAYILNPAAVKRIGFQNPVGEQFGFDDKLGTVVGVTQDFHFESLHKPITPLGIGMAEDDFFNYISIKINSNDFPQTLEQIERAWKDFAPKSPFGFSFFDEHLKRLYAKDQRLSESLNYFSLMALFISCLGIFGLLSFSIKERTKEIGIRKILGAPMLNLLNLLTREIFLILGAATIFGGALGWYAVGKWLDNFAYRFEMRLDVVLIAAILTLIMTLAPISFKLIKSVRANPVESLRSE